MAECSHPSRWHGICTICGDVEGDKSLKKHMVAPMPEAHTQFRKHTAGRFAQERSILSLQENLVQNKVRFKILKKCLLIFKRSHYQEVVDERGSSNGICGWPLCDKPSRLTLMKKTDERHYCSDQCYKVSTAICKCMSLEQSAVRDERDNKKILQQIDEVYRQYKSQKAPKVRVRTRVTEADKRLKRKQRARRKQSRKPVPIVDKNGHVIEELSARAADLRITEKARQTQRTTASSRSSATSSCVPVPSPGPASKEKKRKRRARIRPRRRPRTATTDRPAPSTQPQTRSLPSPPPQHSSKLHAKVAQFWSANPVHDEAALARAWTDLPGKITGMLLAVPSSVFLPRLLADDAFFEKELRACVTVLRKSMDTDSPHAGSETTTTTTTTTTPKPRAQAQTRPPPPSPQYSSKLHAKVAQFWSANPVHDEAAFGRAWTDLPGKITGMLLAGPSSVFLHRLLADDAFFEKELRACVTVLRESMNADWPHAGSQTNTTTTTPRAAPPTAPLPNDAQLSAASAAEWRRLVGQHLYLRVQHLVAGVHGGDGLVSSGTLAGKITGMLLGCDDRSRVHASLRDSTLLRNDFDRAVEVLRRTRDSAALAATESRAAGQMDRPKEIRAPKPPSTLSDSDSPQPEERTVGCLTFVVVPPRKSKKRSECSSAEIRDEARNITPSPLPTPKPTLTMTPTTMLMPLPTPTPAPAPTPQSKAVCIVCGPRGTWMPSQEPQCRVCGRENGAGCQTLEDDKGEVYASAPETDTLEAADDIGAELNWLEDDEEFSGLDVYAIRQQILSQQAHKGRFLMMMAATHWPTKETKCLLLKTRADAEGGGGDNSNASNEGVMNADLDHLPGTREGSIAYQRCLVMTSALNQAMVRLSKLGVVFCGPDGQPVASRFVLCDQLRRIAASFALRDSVPSFKPKEWQVLSIVLLQLFGFSVSTAARPQRQFQALLRKAKLSEADVHRVFKTFRSSLLEPNPVSGITYN